LRTSKVLDDDAVGGGEEGEDVRDEVPLPIVELESGGGGVTLIVE
jgi:hypothetical protein